MIKKILKKSGILVLTFLSGYVFLLGITGNTVHAQESTSTTNTVATTNLSTKMNEWREIGEQISKIATLLLWPFVTVAGIAMDNQMVYGETFGFDSALWKIRNIAKNIANFTLGFYFVYRLFLIIVKGKAEEIKKTIQHTLIAGILIQASRFITAAAVDISTIATYAIGGMPLSVMGETEHSSKYILGSKVFIPTKDNQNIVIIRTTQQNVQEGEGWNISPCKIYPYEENGEKETLIIGREYVYYQNKEQGYPTSKGVCHYQGKIYRFNENEALLLKDINLDTSGILTEMEAAQGRYRKNFNEFPHTKKEIQDLIDNGNIVQKNDPCIEKSHFTWETEEKSNPKLGFDKKNERIGQTGNALKIDDLFEASKSYVGVFSTLYSTLLDSAGVGLTDGTTQNGYLNLLNTALNIGYLAALLLPLTAMVIVLIMRVVILWAVIALSPIIIIINVFGWAKKLSGSLEIFKIGNIISLLVAPVLISFAVSLSTMFIIILKTGINTDFCNIKDNGNILGLFDITIEGVGANLSQLIISVLGIAIVWFLLFWAVKQNSIGKSVGTSIQKMGEKMLGNVPIVPIGGGIGLSQLNPSNPNGLIGKLNTNISNTLRESSNKNIAEILKGTALEDLYKDDISRRNNEKNEIAKKQMKKTIDETTEKTHIDNYINSLKGDGNSTGQYRIRYQEGNRAKEETLELNNLLSNDEIVKRIVAEQEIKGNVRKEAEEKLIALIKEEKDEGKLKELLILAEKADQNNTNPNTSIYNQIKDKEWEFGEKKKKIKANTWELEDIPS